MSVLVLGFFMFLSAVSRGFCLVLDPRGRLGGLGGKVVSDCEEMHTTKMAYWVNASGSSGAGLPGLSQYRAIKCFSLLQLCCSMR